ncbi:MAG: IclR family transcriptional regulator [Solirubrobacterales bacterium]
MTVAVVQGARTIERALCVLDSFTAAEQQWRTTPLAHHCGLPVPTTHRILRVLESFGYVRRDPTSGAYSLGPSAASLAREEPVLAELRAVALPALRTLHHATGERISLATLSESRDHGLEALTVDADDPGQRRRSTPPGTRVRPLHAGAPSKVLLAQMSSEEIASVIGRGLDPVGPATITRPTRLRREVAAIRRRGWAFSRQEIVPETWALAVPVRGSGSTPCALGISAPLARFGPDRARRHLSMLNVAARALAEHLEDTERGESRWQTA